jgi:hypothetical protein
MTPPIVRASIGAMRARGPRAGIAARRVHDFRPDLSIHALSAPMDTPRSGIWELK